MNGWSIVAPATGPPRSLSAPGVDLSIGRFEIRPRRGARLGRTSALGDDDGRRSPPPPDCRLHRDVVHPRTTTLCESCATDEAIAPFANRSPGRRRPDVPRSPVPDSTTAQLRESRDGFGLGGPASTEAAQRGAGREGARLRLDDAERGPRGGGDAESCPVEALDAEGRPSSICRRNLGEQPSRLATGTPPRTTRSGGNLRAARRSGGRPGSRGPRPAVVESVMAGARPRGEADREGRVEAERDRSANVVVEVAVGDEVPRVTGRRSRRRSARSSRA